MSSQCWLLNRENHSPALYVSSVSQLISPHVSFPKYSDSPRLCGSTRERRCLQNIWCHRLPMEKWNTPLFGHQKPSHFGIISSKISLLHRPRKPISPSTIATLLLLSVGCHIDLAHTKMTNQSPLLIYSSIVSSCFDNPKNRSKHRETTVKTKNLLGTKSQQCLLLQSSNV